MLRRSFPLILPSTLLLFLCGGFPVSGAADNVTINAKVFDARLGKVLIEAEIWPPDVGAPMVPPEVAVRKLIQVRNVNGRLRLIANRGTDLRVLHDAELLPITGSRGVDAVELFALQPSDLECVVSAGTLTCRWWSIPATGSASLAKAFEEYQSNVDQKIRASTAAADRAAATRRAVSEELARAGAEAAAAEMDAKHAGETVRQDLARLEECRQRWTGAAGANATRTRPPEGTQSAPPRPDGHTDDAPVTNEAPPKGQWIPEIADGAGGAAKGDATHEGGGVDLAKPPVVTIAARVYEPRLGEVLVEADIKGLSTDGTTAVKTVRAAKVMRVGRAERRLQLELSRSASVRVSRDGEELTAHPPTRLRYRYVLDDLLVLRPSGPKCHAAGPDVRCVWIAKPVFGRARLARQIEAYRERSDQLVRAEDARAQAEVERAAIEAAEGEKKRLAEGGAKSDAERARSDARRVKKELAECEQARRAEALRRADEDRIQTAQAEAAVSRAETARASESRPRIQGSTKSAESSAPRGGTTNAMHAVVQPAQPDEMIQLAPGVERRIILHNGDRWEVVTIDLTKASIHLLGGMGGTDISEATDYVTKHGQRVVAATNAGMFAPDSSPVGLFVVNGEEVHDIVLGPGPGNFGMVPNGVFWIDRSGAAHVRPSEDWKSAAGVRLATQSGPLLLDNGKIHPKFNADSPNRLVRSGIGVSDRNTVHIAISEGNVRFHDMATMFRDVLRCPDALYLDGTVSKLWTEGEPKRDEAGRFSGVLVVAVPAKAQR